MLESILVEQLIDRLDVAFELSLGDLALLVLA